MGPHEIHFISKFLPPSVSEIPYGLQKFLMAFRNSQRFLGIPSSWRNYQSPKAVGRFSIETLQRLLAQAVGMFS
tara:strand:- start:1491 stop:1712 length:222 start_codon:yes stop_codon:yes gene_type:complete